MISKTDRRPPDAKEWPKAWNPHGMMLQFAWAIAEKSKDELIEIVAGMSDEYVKTTLEHLRDSEVFFGAFAEVLRAAHTRMLVASAAPVTKPEKAEARA